MSVHSAAILLRYLTDPASRNFEWDDAVVITAMTGDESKQTGRDVEDHILPQLRQHSISYLQVAHRKRHVTKVAHRKRHVTKDGDGWSSSPTPRSRTKIYPEGDYKLSAEMPEAGTIPQSGSLCSVHAKGDALDPVIARVTDDRPLSADHRRRGE